MIFWIYEKIYYFKMKIKKFNLILINLFETSIL